MYPLKDNNHVSRTNFYHQIWTPPDKNEDLIHLIEKKFLYSIMTKI